LESTVSVPEVGLPTTANVKFSGPLSESEPVKVLVVVSPSLIENDVSSATGDAVSWE